MKSTSKPLDSAVQEFRQKYLQHVNTSAPDLKLEAFESANMKEKNDTWLNKKPENKWIKFYKGLDANPYLSAFSLYLKPDGGKQDPFGRASLTIDIGPKNDKHEFVKENLACVLEPNMEVIDAKTSLSVNIKFKALHTTEPFEDQIDAVNQSIVALRHLQSWFKIN